MSKEKFNVVKIILNKSIFDENVIHMILKYYWQLLDKRKVLLDWIDIHKLEWDSVCLNPNAIDLLENNIDKINWSALCCNPNGINLIETELKEDELNEDEYYNFWFGLTQNPNAIEILLKNKNKIH